jgi:hypothetical protein
MRHLLHIQLLITTVFIFQLKFEKFFLQFNQTPKETSQELISRSYDTSNNLSAVATIDSLKIGHSYSINVKSNGCFHHSNLNLKITKEPEGYFASLKIKGKIEGEKVNIKLKNTKLNFNTIDSIRNFERQLVLISTSQYGCTTVDQYTLTVDSFTNTFVVDKCEWKGIREIVNTLFNKTK